MCAGPVCAVCERIERGQWVRTEEKVEDIISILLSSDIIEFDKEMPDSAEYNYYGYLFKIMRPLSGDERILLSFSIPDFEWDGAPLTMPLPKDKKGRPVIGPEYARNWVNWQLRTLDSQSFGGDPTTFASHGWDNSTIADVLRQPREEDMKKYIEDELKKSIHEGMDLIPIQSDSINDVEFDHYRGMIEGPVEKGAFFHAGFLARNGRARNSNRLLVEVPLFYHTPDFFTRFGGIFKHEIIDMHGKLQWGIVPLVAHHVVLLTNRNFEKVELDGVPLDLEIHHPVYDHEGVRFNDSRWFLNCNTYSGVKYNAYILQSENYGDDGRTEDNNKQSYIFEFNRSKFISKNVKKIHTGDNVLNVGKGPLNWLRDLFT